MKHDRVFPARPAKGAAVLQAELTSALMRSALIELARNGYVGMSMGAVARRAKVGKPALYRRWSGKEELVAELLLQVGMPIVSVEDMGSLERELQEYARRSITLLRRPLARAILPDVYREMTRNSALGNLIKTHFQEPKRQKAMLMLDRAIARGEISNAINRPLALDLMAGPLYWRMIVMREDVSDEFAGDFARTTVCALQGT